MAVILYAIAHGVAASLHIQLAVMKILLALLYSILPVINCLAQKHDYNLFFGYCNGCPGAAGGTTLNFNYKPSQFYKENKQINFGGSDCVMSDSIGNYIFSTNGISIRNKTHGVMQDGEKINPGTYWNKNYDDSYPSSTQPFAVPAPGMKNFYYLLHFGIEEVPFSGGIDIQNSPFYYSLIDMNQNNGLGRVIKVNQVITKGNLIPQAITKHGNGRDWWVITGLLDQPVHYLFLISSSGISGPFEQQIGPPFPSWEGGGNPIFTPDGNTYIRPDAHNGMRIYDFDRCTGQLSNLRILPYTDPFYIYGLVFSWSSRFLYGLASQEMMQFDMTAPDLGTSMDTIAMNDGFVIPFPPFQPDFWRGTRGPDGKIYLSSTGSSIMLHVIHQPELPGQACDIAVHGIKLPTTNYWSMPAFPNYRLGQWQDSPCDTLPQRPSGGFTPTLYTPAMRTDTTYRLLTPIPDKTQSPDIYFRRKDLPNPPEMREWFLMMND